MARLFTTGAEEPDALAMWDDMNTTQGAKGNLVVAQGRVKDRIITPRTGRGMYELANSARYLQWWTPTYPSEIYVGFAVRIPYFDDGAYIVRPYTNAAQDTSYHMSLRVTSSGALRLYRHGTLLQTTGVCLTIDTWHYIEAYFKPRNTSGSIIVRVDGTEVGAVGGDTTDSTEYINGITFIGLTNSASYISTYFDDIVLNDTSGSYNNSWPGQVRLLPIRPRVAGNYAQWYRGGVDLGSDVAQVLNGTHDFSMLQVNSADQKVTFDTEVPNLPDGAQIKNIVVSAQSRVQNGSGVIAPMVRANGTDNISADQTLASSWKHKQYAWAKNPEDGMDWEEADIANLEIGVSS